MKTEPGINYGDIIVVFYILYDPFYNFLSGKPQ